tara:strand:+ start:1972 stop:3363 length:1392 start_codon:yes stop_codon:yes gene_type:complete
MKPGKDIYPINGSEFFCKFNLTGPSIDPDKPGEINFTKAAVQTFELEENFFEPFANASVTVNNPFDFVENNVFTRGDGRDTFSITLFNNLDKRPKDEIKLEYDFVIVNENNSVSKTDRSNNFKTYTLVEKNYFKLNEQIPYGKRYGGGGRGGTGVAVGDMIKEILEDVLESDIVDLENWEPGDMIIDNFPEYIIPPRTFRYSDLIRYLLRIYYFIDGNLPCQAMLTFDRVKKKYQLRPISKIFGQNSKLTQEAFGIGDLTNIKNEGTVGSNPIDEKVPVNEYTNALKNTNFTTPMVTWSNEFFTNYTISTTDRVLGTEVQELMTIKDIKDDWTKSYVDVFKCVGGKPEPFLPINQSKADIFKPFALPFKPEHVRNIAKAQMVSNLTFYNLQLAIDNIGDTARKAGKFIDIFKRNNDEEIVDKKLLGRWFVTKVRHLFNRDRYYNVISCIKTCVGPGQEIKDVK